MTDITITRDRWGIAHVVAPDTGSAFSAQGYCAAADRIWQMEWDRRRATGTWAEVVGPSAVREDAFFRRIGLEASARDDWEALSDRAKAMTVAYADGVNRWLTSHGEALPPEFVHHPRPPVPWEPWHCVAVYKVRHIFMGTLYRKLWRGAVTRSAGAEVALAMRGDPGAATPMIESPEGVPTIDLLDQAAAAVVSAAEDLAAIADVDGASNSWAVHGSRTASGMPLLAGDPHRGIEFPNVYLQFHMACDAFDVMGLSFPGVPGFPHFGHNADVAWCITHGAADDTDVFVEEVDDIVGRRIETISVRNGEPVEIVVGASARGPYILGDLGRSHALCVAWTGLHADSTFECLEPMLLADGCDALEESVRDWVVPVNNLLTSDTAGNISFKIRGRVLERAPANRWTPVSGSDASSWDGLVAVDHDDLQQWRNPERGFLVTANNRTSDHGPFISVDFAGPYRHDRIVELLAGLDAATVDDMTAIHRDVRSLIAPKICQRLVVAGPSTELGLVARDLLAVWDHDLTADSPAALVYGTVRRLWALEVEARLGLADVSFGEVGWPRVVDSSRMLFDSSTTLLVGGGWSLLPGLDSRDDLTDLLAGLIDRAAADIAADHGEDPSRWRWDAEHVMVSPHPLATALEGAGDLHPPVSGCPGDGDTIRCGSVTPALGLRAYSASVARYVFDTSDWDNSGWVVPHGVSGTRGSGHDLDQREAWLAGELHPMAYSAAAVAAVAADVRNVAL